MIALDHPPAIIVPRAVTPFRFIINDGKEHDCGPCLPRDFAAMPRQLRWALAHEARAYLPEPYRRLSDGMLQELLGSIGGLPGVLMAGGIKTAWLYTISGIFPVPAYWTNSDNAIHGVGAGGNGRNPTQSDLSPGNYYGGPSGGGSAWAAADNSPLVAFSSYALTVAAFAGDQSSFDVLMVAKGGGSGGSISGGSGSGGSAGDASSSVGNRKSNGGVGQGVSGFSSTAQGGQGGGAGGPHGDGIAGINGGHGDAAQGGHGGLQGTGSDLGWHDGQDGVDGPAGGWNPGYSPNAGSGGGGGRGNGGFGSGYDPNGHDGGDYGGGAGGGGVSAPLGQVVGVAGNPSLGCVLLINNASL